MSILILTIALAASPKLNRVELLLVHQTNVQRTRYGLAKLTVDAELQKSARKHCKWMMRTGRMVHSSYPVYENCAQGQRTVKEVLRGWMGSKGHRANILSPKTTKIGVAGYRGRNGRTWWVQQFK